MSSNPLLWINRSKYKSLGGLSWHLVEEKTNINKKKNKITCKIVMINGLVIIQTKGIPKVR
jgi:hypothetical protein